MALSCWFKPWLGQNSYECVCVIHPVKGDPVCVDAQWEGMGDVGSARYEPALLPPCPTIRVLSYSNWICVCICVYLHLFTCALFIYPTPLLCIE